MAVLGHPNSQVAVPADFIIRSSPHVNVLPLSGGLLRPIQPARLPPSPGRATRSAQKKTVKPALQPVLPFNLRTKE
jgi:hypothetical protein